MCEAVYCVRLCITSVRLCLCLEPCVGANLVMSGDASNASVWAASGSSVRLDTINSKLHALLLCVHVSLDLATVQMSKYLWSTILSLMLTYLRVYRSHKLAE